MRNDTLTFYPLFGRKTQSFTCRVAYRGSLEGGGSRVANLAVERIKFLKNQERGRIRCLDLVLGLSS